MIARTLLLRPGQFVVSEKEPILELAHLVQEEAPGLCLIAGSGY